MIESKQTKDIDDLYNILDLDKAKVKALEELPKEEMDDKILANILKLIEIYETSVEVFHKHYYTEDIEFSLYFINSKINELLDLQQTFSLKDKSNRFSDISLYLDAFTTEIHQHNTMDDFEIKISSLLDTLYLSYSNLIQISKDFD